MNQQLVTNNPYLPTSNIQYNNFPEVDFFSDQFGNPTISSPNCDHQISFYQTKDSLMDTEVYNQFLKNSIQRFRNSVTYRHYKGFLIEMGLDKCQFMSNLTAEEIDLEMHHTILTIRDIGYIICEHVLNTVGRINTFQLSQLIRQEHMLHNVPVCMLSLTAHQLYHNEEDFFISPKMVFGNWFNFIKRYRYGLSQDIAYKIYYYLKRAQDEDDLSNDHEWLELRDMILNWAECGASVSYN